MFGFAQPLQHRLPSGAQQATAATAQAQAAAQAATQVSLPKVLSQPAPATPASLPTLPSATPATPAGQATMMPSTDLPPLTAPTVPQGTGIEDSSASIPGGLDAAGGDGMDIGELLSALFG